MRFISFWPYNKTEKVERQDDELMFIKKAKVTAWSYFWIPWQVARKIFWRKLAKKHFKRPSKSNSINAKFLILRTFPEKSIRKF